MSFLKSESGAVTVNWVWLTGAVVALGLGITGIVGTGMGTASQDMEATLSDEDERIKKTFDQQWDLVAEMRDLASLSGGAWGPEEEESVRASLLSELSRSTEDLEGVREFSLEDADAVEAMATLAASQLDQNGALDYDALASTYNANMSDETRHYTAEGLRSITSGASMAATGGADAGTSSGTVTILPEAETQFVASASASADVSRALAYEIDRELRRRELASSSRARSQPTAHSVKP